MGAFTASSSRTRIKFDFLIFDGGGGSRPRQTFLLGLRRGVDGGLSFALFLIRGMASLAARVGFVVGEGRPGIGHSGLLLYQQRRL